MKCWCRGDVLSVECGKREGKFCKREQEFKG